ncbi:MAG TPA: ABC transporter permease [Candidatus Angelobacter sp.]
MRFFRRRRWDQERARELSSYLELETAENIARGMPPEAAASAAHCKLGNTTRVREEIYRMNSLGFLETIWQDLRYAARMLRKNPGFTLVAVLTLTLGIGANTAIFSMVEWLVFQQLPIQDPKELTYLGFSRGGAVHNDTRFSFREYQEIREACGDQFKDLSAAAFGGSAGGQSGPDGMTVQGVTRPVETFFVSSNFFSLLGLKPTLGRFFEPGEGNTAGADPVVILAWEYWQSRFHGDPQVIGKAVAINGHPVTIIGVAPHGFVGPTPAIHMQAYLQLGMLVIEAGTLPDFLSQQESRPFMILARLKHGGNVEQVRPALAILGKRLLQENPRPDEKAGSLGANILRPPALFSAEGSNPLVKFAAMLLVLGIFVLLLACLNVANLLLVRATLRRGEMALRAALGAARGRLIRQLMTESVLLALFGGGGGIAVGLVVTRMLASLDFPTALPVSLDLRFNWLVFTFAFAVALVAGLIVGVVPALRASRSNLNDVLHESQRTSSGGRQRLRNFLVSAQVAGAMTLLIVAGLFTRSLRGVQHADLGFDPRQVTNFTLDANQIGYPQVQGETFYRELLARARALPGVDSASLAAWLPMGDTQFGGRIDIPGVETPKGEARPSALYIAISPGYFRTMGISILRGRDLTDADSATAQHVALINQTMAEKYWPGKDPVGRQFSVPEDPGHPVHIVGVVRNFRMVDPYSPIDPAYFVPLAQHYFATQTLQIRAAGDPNSLTRNIVTAIDTLSPAMPVYGVGSMTKALNGLNGLYGFRLIAILTGVLGSMGLVLATVGVFGVMSYSVSQRTREIGIRMALGAQRGQILSLIGRQGILVILSGIVVGLLLAFAVGQLIQDFLVGVGAADAVTYITISALLAAVALAACFVPVRRAVRVDPMVALRAE